MTENPSLRKPRHRVFRKFGYLALAHGLRSVLEAAFFIWLARSNVIGYGQMMLALSIGQIASFATEFGLNQHLVGRLTRPGGDESEILSQVTLLKAFLFLITAGALVVFIRWQGYEPGLAVLVLVMVLGCGIDAVASTFYVVCQVHGRQHAEGWMRGAASGLGFGYGLAGLALKFRPASLGAFRIVEAAANLAGALTAAGRTVRIRFAIPRLASLVNEWRVSLVFTGIAVTSILYNRINMLFLQNFGGSQQVAQYGAAWQMVDGLSAVVSNLMLKNVLYPLFATLWVSDRRELEELARDTCAWLLAAGTALVFAFAGESATVIRLVYGSGFADAAWAQRVLSVTIVIAFVHNLAAYLMMGMGRARLLFVMYAVGLAVNALCCVFLIPGDPLKGTVYAIVLTKAVIIAMTAGYAQARLRILRGRDAWLFVLCAAAGGLLYAGLRPLGLPILPTLAACMPLTGLAAKWALRARAEARHAAASGRPGE